jgi:acetyl-CoA carboxylase biotin carboxyl carrier protein
MSDELLRSEAIDELVPDAAAPMAVGPGPGPDPALEAAPVESAVPAPRDRGDVELLGLIDRLSALLDRSDLTELEVESGGTALVLRKPSALTAPATATVLASAEPASPATGAAAAAATGEAPAAETRPSIKAPLTGIFYASPAPGSAPYVAVGREVAVGQVIGLIEAMKLFNEIKSDLAGRVVRVVPESGSLVKAKQPLIEVEPL